MMELREQLLKAFDRLDLDDKITLIANAILIYHCRQLGIEPPEIYFPY